MRIRNQLLPGVWLLECPYFQDQRGSLTKYFHTVSLDALGIDFIPKESFLTESLSGVLRGMHYQSGTAAHDKLVSCVSGDVLDVVVNICPESPFFNKPISIYLNENDRLSLLISKEYAHGFLSLAPSSRMLYYTSTVHCPEKDSGVLWSSINFNWPIESTLIVSPRDSALPPIQQLV